MGSYVVVIYMFYWVFHVPHLGHVIRRFPQERWNSRTDTGVIKMNARARIFSMLTLLLFAVLAMPVLAGGKHYGKKHIVSMAASTGEHATLVKAIKAADLEDTLSNDGPYTVFAPTDAAFQKLPPGTLDDLLKPENREQLRAILLHHVVNGKVMSQQARTLDQANSLHDAALTFTNDDNGDLYVSGAKVTKADLVASNGIIHVVDTVILPPEE